MRKSILTIIVSLFALAVTSFGAPFLYAQQPGLSQDKNGNLELHVVTDETVNIKVFIDDKPAIDAQFQKDISEERISIAPHKVFYFNFQPGKHTLRAEAQPGNQSFTGEFEVINNKQWLALSYVDPQRIKQKEQFTLEVYDHQIWYQ